MKKFKKLSLRLAILAVLVGGLFFAYNDKVSAQGGGNAGYNYVCEVQFGWCMAGCGEPIDYFCNEDCHGARDFCYLMNPWSF